MASFDFNFQGEDYRVDAVNEEQALRKLQAIVGSQAAENMLPSPVDFGPAPMVTKKNEFGDTTREYMAGPASATSQYMGQAMDAGFGVDKAGERLGNLGMAALSGLGTVASGVAGMAGEIGTPIQNALRSAAGMPTLSPKTAERRGTRDALMAMEVAAPELMGGVPSSIARQGKQVAAPNIVGGRAYGEMTPTMEGARAAERAGVVPPASFQNRTARMVEAGLEASPVTTTQVQAARERASDQIKTRLQTIAEQSGEVLSPERAGEVLRQSGADFIDNFKSRSEVLYSTVDKFIPANQAVVATQTVTELNKFLRKTNTTPELASLLDNSMYSKMLKDIGQTPVGTPIPYDTLKRLRSMIGEAIGQQKGPLANASERDLGILYGALTEDMGQIARAHGDNAFNAWSRANKYYAAGQKRIKDVIMKVTNVDTDIAAYENLIGMMKSGQRRQSTARIAAIKKSLKPEDFASFRASLIKNLGMAKAGGQNAAGDAFSASTFLTEYNKLDETARRIVFGDANADILDLAKVVEMAKDADNALNTSRTAPALSTQAVGTSLMAAAVSPMGYAPYVIGGFLAAKGTAGIFTNQRVLKALNAAAKQDMKPLQRLAGGDGFFQAEATTLLRMLGADVALDEQDR